MKLQHEITETITYHSALSQPSRRLVKKFQCVTILPADSRNTTFSTKCGLIEEISTGKLQLMYESI
jgi:hypothetical protein